MAIARMMNVMMGKTKSRRHNLFLVKRELDQCALGLIGPLYLHNSRLQQLSNPNFLGDQDTWYIVVNKLSDIVFSKFFSHADPQLKKVVDIIGDKISMMYSIYVLFPETFIHRFEVNYPLYLTF